MFARLMLAAAAASVLAATPATAGSKLKVGQPSPDFELTLMDGSKIKLSQMRGDVVLVNFWATWCVPCRKELPLLDGYYRQTKKYGLRVFAVTTEDSVPARKLKPLFDVMAIPAAKRVKGGALSDVEAVPTNYVIDRAGIVRHTQAGAFELDDLNRILIPLLKEDPPEDVAAVN
ncbi:MAG: TlpA disulfide reductase family protein [Sphingomicrobium sp.]